MNDLRTLFSDQDAHDGPVLVASGAPGTAMFSAHVPTQPGVPAHGDVAELLFASAGPSLDDLFAPSVAAPAPVLTFSNPPVPGFTPAHVGVAPNAQVFSHQDRPVYIDPKRANAARMEMLTRQALAAGQLPQFSSPAPVMAPARGRAPLAYSR